MNKLFLLCLCAGISFSQYTQAQNSSSEFGVFGGWSNYSGDLQQNQYERDEMQPAYGVFIRHNFNDFIALKAQVLKGSISGADSNYSSLLVSKERNLHFRSDIYEAALQAEISFMKFGENNKKVAAPYLLVGVSVFHFNPQAKFEGDWYDLQPFGTEGQGMIAHPEKKKYELTQFAIPLGVGFNIALGDKAQLGFEMGFRKTFTDYLDDVSGQYPDVASLKSENEMAGVFSYRAEEVTRGEMPNPIGNERGTRAGNDAYGFGGICLSFKF
ncbi:MAG: hypothetical protein ACI85O_002408 [Saprospiraceae bacterium]|jgi:hypothetical protein